MIDMYISAISAAERCSYLRTLCGDVEGTVYLAREQFLGRGVLALDHQCRRQLVTRRVWSEIRAATRRVWGGEV